MRKYLLGAAILTLMAAASCKKDRDMKKAVVVDSGDVALGGCGYLLRLESDGRMVRPQYLPSAFQHDGQKVKVKFDADGEGDVCQTNNTYQFMEIIQLTDIKKDLD